jgi:hypothetical protein
MWIVLREYDGDLVAAAERLAREWSSDVVTVRAAMEAAVTEWRDAGLVTTHPGDGREVLQRRRGPVGLIRCDAHPQSGVRPGQGICHEEHG